MFDVAVAGVVNVEVSAPINGWPVEYQPVWFPSGQIGVRPAGVGFGVASALASLGWRVRLATFVARDPLGRAM